MEPIKLIQPTAEYAEQIAAYRQEFLDADNSMDGCGSLRRLADPLEWIAYEKLCQDPVTVPEGKVPATLFLSVRERDNKLLGMIQVRHVLSDYLRRFGGHIGYSIRPSERRKGYATEQLRLALNWCKNELKLDRVLITCHPDNLGSKKTILKHGGAYETTNIDESRDNRALELYWIDLKARG